MIKQSLLCFDKVTHVDECDYMVLLFFFKLLKSTEKMLIAEVEYFVFAWKKT